MQLLEAGTREEVAHLQVIALACLHALDTVGAHTMHLGLHIMLHVTWATCWIKGLHIEVINTASLCQGSAFG